MKTEAPTESKLESLREQGIVPIFPFATHCFSLAAALVVLAFRLEGAVFEWSMQSMKLAGQIALFPLCAYVVVYLVMALVQSKAYFRMQFTRPSFGYMLYRESSALFVASLVIACGVLVVRLPMLPGAATVLFREMPAFAAVPALIRAFLYYFAAFSALLGAVSWVVARMSFLREHRMTRDEIMQEGRH